MLLVTLIKKLFLLFKNVALSTQKRVRVLQLKADYNERLGRWGGGGEVRGVCVNSVNSLNEAVVLASSQTTRVTPYSLSNFC